MTTKCDRDPIFSQYGTDDLIRARECLGWDLCECQQSDEPPSTIANGVAFIQMQLDSIDAEIARRERLRALPGAPAWPSEPTPELRDYWRRIKEQVTVLHVWEQHFPMQPLRKAGRNWRGRCPFHGGTNPNSFSVFKDGRSWHCFVCSVGGDVFAFAGLLYRTTRFREIADRLAADFGIEAPKPTVPVTSSPTSHSDEPAKLVTIRVGG